MDPEAERIDTEAKEQERKPKYRSEAEKIAVHQRNATIVLGLMTLCLNTLTVLRVFDIL